MGLVFFLGSGGRSQWSTLESGPLEQEHTAISLSKFIG